MISCTTICAIILRYMRVWKRDFNLLLGMFYWPLLDILIWGFLGSWIQQAQSSISLHNYEVIALLGILLWQIIGRGCVTMVITFTEELWSNNVVNLFSLPVHIIEWMLGVILFSALMIIVTSFYCMLIMFLLYDLPLLLVVKTFFIFFPPLFLSSLWLGFTCLQILFTLGKRGMELGFVIAWFLAPFSGAFYPLEILPMWAQQFSALLPMSYVFQGMRGYVMYQQDPTVYLIKGYLMGSLYALCSLTLFVYCFNRSKQKGLARLVD